MKRFSTSFLLIAFGLFSLIGSLKANSALQSIILLKVGGVINPVTSQYVSNGIKEAEEKKAAAVLIEIDTPGGLLDSTRTTISSMINSSLPIIVYVGPRGARATSAGVFITMASDIAAMAPGTHLGAAHPVTISGSGGEEESPAQQKSEEKGKKDEKKNEGANNGQPKKGSVMEEKMVSDAAAYIRGLAKEKNRNAEWAEKAVRESVSLTAEEAVEQNVVEIIADDRQDLLKKIHEKQIKKNGKTITIRTQNVPIEEIPLTTFQKFLHMIAHPNVAYILMMLGFYGLIYEFSSPGIGLGGAVGVICLVMAFFSLQVLPINTVGLILIVLGIACLILDLITPTYGLLTFGGLVAFALGSFFLIDVPRDFSIPRVSLSLIFPTVLVTGFFFGWAVKKVLQARKRKKSTGQEGLIGAEGIVKEIINPEGMIFISGELWTAESTEVINIGETVVVERIAGNKVFVRKK